MNKSLIQCWVIIAIGGAIGLTALAWNGSYEKGSAIAALHEVFDTIKTQILESREDAK